MIFCARATRGRGLPSLGLMARLGVPVGGRVRKLRAVGDHSGHHFGSDTSKFRGSIGLMIRVVVNRFGSLLGGRATGESVLESSGRNGEKLGPILSGNGLGMGIFSAKA